MYNKYILAAQKVNNLADEFSEDNDLVTLLRSGSSKLMKLAQKNGTLIKVSSNQSEKHQKAVNE